MCYSQIWQNFTGDEYYTLYRVGQKNWTCLSVDNSVMVRRVIRQKFHNAVKNK